jgi:hypothetical protein
MSTLFRILPILSFGLALLFFSMSSGNRAWNVGLVLSPSLVAQIYCSLEQKNVLQVISSGSVGSRIQFILVFASPILIGLLGLSNIKPFGSSSNRVRSEKMTSLMIFLVPPLLSGLSVFFLRPVNGIGQSVYVPFVVFLLSIFSILVIFSQNLELKDVTEGAEGLLVATYLFLLMNAFGKFFSWGITANTFLLSSPKDQFRFSPFAAIFGSSIRESFFANDPEGFALFSLMSIVLLISSKRKFIKYFGSVLVFIAGSLSQSRMFYFGVFIVLLLKLLFKIFSSVIIYLKIGFYVFAMLSYFLVFLTFQNSVANSSLTSFSGRTYIWNTILDHWSDNGIFFGHSGSYSTHDYCLEFGCKFEFFEAHNLFLEYLWNWGIFGIGIAIVALAFLWLKSLKLQEQGFFLIASMSLAGLIEAVLSLNSINILFLFELIALKYIADSVETQIQERQEVK